MPKGKPPAKPFAKGVSPNPAGRPKGSRNKVPRAMREIILGAVNKMGDSQALADWYRASPKNRTKFWRDIAPMVLPKVIEGSERKPVVNRIEH